MTDMTAIIWVAVITCWLLIGIPTTYCMLTSKEREDVQVHNYISPGAVCVLTMDHDQRRRLAQWIDEECDVPKPLQSFRRQVLRATPVNGVPVYHGQAEAVSALLERRGLVDLAKDIRGH